MAKVLYLKILTLLVLVVVVKVFLYKMAKIIIHKDLTVEELNEKRLFDDFKLTHKERMNKAFKLMKLALLFSQKDKTTFKKGIIIKKA